MAAMSMTAAFLAMMMAVAAGAAAPPNCDSSATALVPCYTYVTGLDEKPPTDCCGGLSTLNSNSPACLCQLITQLNGSAASQPSVNLTKAYNLPKDCAIALSTSGCPALANLPTSPPTTPSTAVPTTSSPAPTAAGPGAALTPGNDGLKLLPTRWMVLAIGAAATGALCVGPGLWWEF